MRVILVCVLLAFAVTVQAVTPELGKDQLRRLIKLPSVSFQSDWTFDPEHGFTVGPRDEDKAAQIASLSKELEPDGSDPAGYHRLGKLYADVGDFTNARKALAKSVQLYRNRIELQSDDAVLLTEFGRTLQDAGQADEAESVLRRAVRLAPKEAKCWLALGRFLDTESRHDLSGHGAASAPTAGSDPTPPALAPDSVAQARKRLAEAGDCYEQAIHAAPEDSEAWLRRGLHRTLRSFLLNTIDEATGARKPETEVFQDLFSPASLLDLQQASRLNAKDYHLIGNVALFEVYSANAMNGHIGLDSGFGWAALPDASQRSLRNDMIRLEDLSGDNDRKVAAGALEMLGVLQGRVLHQTSPCQATLRRALALDPSREQAWEILASTLAKSEKYQDLLSLCEVRLKQDDSARSHILLAKAHEKLKHWDAAEEQVLGALKLAPNDLAINLSLAALILKRSQDAEDLDEANGWLQRCDQILKDSQGQKSRQLIIELTLTRSIYFGLTDDVDSARKWAQSVLDTDKDNQLAQEIITAMSY